VPALEASLKRPGFSLVVVQFEKTSHQGMPSEVAEKLRPFSRKTPAAQYSARTRPTHGSQLNEKKYFSERVSRKIPINTRILS
jgi:hypothetical protein